MDSLNNAALDKISDNLHIIQVVDLICAGFRETTSPDYKNVVYNLTKMMGKTKMVELVAEVRRLTIAQKYGNLPGGLLLKLAKQRLGPEEKKMIFTRQRGYKVNPTTLSKCDRLQEIRLGLAAVHHDMRRRLMLLEKELADGRQQEKCSCDRCV